jgi:hypothetical protein
MSRSRRVAVVPCPRCAASIGFLDLHWAGPFPCPVCRRAIRIGAAYDYVTCCGSVALTGALLWPWGLRWWALLLGTLLLMYPVMFVVRVWLFRLLPPALQPVWHSFELYDAVGSGADDSSSDLHRHSDLRPPP